MRILAPTFFGLFVFALWAYAIVDIAATDPTLTRRLSKTLWFVVVLLTAGVGAIAWLAFGRPLNGGWMPGDSNVPQRRRFVGPEDRADWSPPGRAGSQPRLDSSETARRAHPAGEASRDRDALRDSTAATERRRMEQEAERVRRESTEPDSDDTGN